MSAATDARQPAAKSAAKSTAKAAAKGSGQADGPAGLIGDAADLLDEALKVLETRQKSIAARTATEENAFYDQARRLSNYASRRARPAQSTFLIWQVEAGDELLERATMARADVAAQQHAWGTAIEHLTALLRLLEGRRATPSERAVVLSKLVDVTRGVQHATLVWALTQLLAIYETELKDQPG